MAPQRRTGNRGERRRARFMTFGAAIAVVVLASCSSSSSTQPAHEVSPAGDIPDSQVFVPYTSLDGVYAVDVPEGWARTTDGSVVTFADKLNSIALASTTASAAPTAASVKADELSALSTEPGFRLRRVDTVPAKSGPAVRIEYQVDGASDPVTGKMTRTDAQQLEFWKNGRLLTITFSSPAGADNVDPWKTVIDSVRWLQ